MSTVPRLEHFDLSGRSAVVLFAHTPPGSAIARAYAEAGARLVLAVPPRGEGPARSLAEELRRAGARCELTVADDVGTAVEAAAAALGELDVLASCPDRFLAKPIGDTSDAELERVIEVNFISQFRAARAASRQMGNAGNLVLVTHVLGERGLPNCTAYGAAQAATQNLIRALAQELAPRHISVNGISLGWMDWMDDRIDPSDEEAGRAVRFTIMKRAGHAEEIGPLAVWLSGSGAGYVTGQIFAVDGGLLQHL